MVPEKLSILHHLNQLHSCHGSKELWHSVGYLKVVRNLSFLSCQTSGRMQLLQWGWAASPSRLALRLSPASPTLSALFISALKDGPNVIRQVGRIDPLTCSRRSRTPRPASQFWTLLCTRSREEDHWEAVVFVQMSWCHGDSNDSDA